MQVNKEKTLSSSWFRAYKYGILGLISLFLGLYAYSVLMNHKVWIALPMVLLYGWFVIKYWFPSFRKVMIGFRKISYNEAFLYIHEKGYDVEVPLERVKAVALISLDGIYKFEFYDEDQFGKAVYCKPSIWYPFNFPLIDSELDRIRTLIEKRKKLVWNEDSAPRLGSQNV